MSKFYKIVVSLFLILLGIIFIILIYFNFYNNKYIYSIPVEEISTGHQTYISDSVYYENSILSGEIQACDNIIDNDRKMNCKFNYFMNNQSLLNTGNCLQHLSGAQLERCLDWSFFHIKNCKNIINTGFKLECTKLFK